MTAYCKFCNKEVTKEECIECENGQYIHHLCNMYVNFDEDKIIVNDFGVYFLKNGKERQKQEVNN